MKTRIYSINVIYYEYNYIRYIKPGIKNIYITFVK